MPIAISAGLAFAIKIFFQAVMERAWKRLEGKTEEEILEMAKQEKDRSSNLQDRQEEE